MVAGEGNSKCYGGVILPAAAEAADGVVVVHVMDKETPAGIPGRNKSLPTIRKERGEPGIFFLPVRSFP